jgi:hypothetical protein
MIVALVTISPLTLAESKKRLEKTNIKNNLSRTEVQNVKNQPRKTCCGAQLTKSLYFKAFWG